jgi:hypothetical protein
MRSRLWLAAAALLFASCAVHPPAPETFSFAVMGDAPYNDAEEPVFLDMLERVGREDVAFVVHVGDFKAGNDSPCTDALFERRKVQFARSAHPFVYTPGDNDWSDCQRASNGGRDPSSASRDCASSSSRERDRSGAQATPGRRRHRKRASDTDAAACRCGPFVENRMWERGGVVFVPSTCRRAATAKPSAVPRPRRPGSRRRPERAARPPAPWSC